MSGGWVHIDWCASLEDTQLHSNEIFLPYRSFLSQENVYITFAEKRFNHWRDRSILLNLEKWPCSSKRRKVGNRTCAAFLYLHPQISAVILMKRPFFHLPAV